VRIRKDSIRGRVKSDLPVVFSDEKLSSYGGLELFRRFVDRSGFADQLKQVFSIRQFDGDYGSFRIALALIGMLLLGGTRLRHLRNLERDPLFLRFARLNRLPTDRTVSNTLKQTTKPMREGLSELLRTLAYDTAREAGLSRVTIDLDGTVLRTGLFADGAERGFNPHHPKDKSYYPLTAHLAQTGQLLAVMNRAGNVHDSERAVELLEFLVRDVREQLAPRHLEARFDGAFFRREMLTSWSPQGWSTPSRPRCGTGSGSARRSISASGGSGLHRGSRRSRRSCASRSGSSRCAWWSIASTCRIARARTSSSTCSIRPTDTTSTRRWPPTRTAA
jgi:hypothetical protein